MARTLILALVLMSGSALAGTPDYAKVLKAFPKGEAHVVNILKWGPNELPKIYERSDQLPLSEADLTKLHKAGFGKDELIQMLEERRCACDASADGLIRLKKAGMHKDVISAVSRHALAPNRAVTVQVTLDFSKNGSSARESYLYFFVDDGDFTRVFTVDLNEVLSGKEIQTKVLEASDMVLNQQVRRIELAGDVTLKSYGKHHLVVATSSNPSLLHPSQLTEKESKAARTYSFDYPRASLQNLCRLHAGYQRDAVLLDKWHFLGSRFECEWN